MDDEPAPTPPPVKDAPAPRPRARTTRVHARLSILRQALAAAEAALADERSSTESRAKTLTILIRAESDLLALAAQLKAKSDHGKAPREDDQALRAELERDIRALIARARLEGETGEDQPPAGGGAHG